jgi:hypothetical protein
VQQDAKGERRSQVLAVLLTLGLVAALVALFVWGGFASAGGGCGGG